MDGELLTGGGLNQVFRVDDAVRRPAGPWAPRVHELLRHLAPLGIAPVPLGLDGEHELLSYLPGDVGHVFPSDDASLIESARMLRRLHDATLDLTEYLGSVIETDGITEATQKIGEIDGTIYGFTLGTATSAFVYNPTVWEAAGATPPSGDFAWEDLIEAGEKIRANTDGKVAAISDPGGMIAWFATPLPREVSIW